MNEILKMLLLHQETCTSFGAGEPLDSLIFEQSKKIKAAIEELVTKSDMDDAMLAELESPGKYNPAPAYTSNYIHPAAPHGVDVEATIRTGHTVCLCASWTPGEPS